MKQHVPFMAKSHPDLMSLLLTIHTIEAIFEYKNKNAQVPGPVCH